MIIKLAEISHHGLINGLCQVQHLIALGNKLLNKRSRTSHIHAVGSLQDKWERRGKVGGDGGGRKEMAFRASQADKNHTL
jgi:hypothetical protein